MTSVNRVTLAALLLVVSTFSLAEEDREGRYGIGQALTPEHIAEWDKDVRPDGQGLPPGQGSVAEGAAVYAAHCASCHGAEGEGGLNDRLVSAFDPSVNFSEGNVTRTIGNYWPYATTLFDYIQRAMPFTAPGSLTHDELYAVTAWLLSRNGILDEETVLDAKVLAGIDMPARHLFYWSEEVSSLAP